MGSMLKYVLIENETFCMPKHNMVEGWVFEYKDKEEAKLCYAMAVVAEKNGININEFEKLFPATLRMLKSKSKWG